MIIAISQRVEFVESYKERRDCLDQRWFDLFNSLGMTLIPIPNNKVAAEAIMKKIKINGIVLSGGGDLLAYGGQFPERDETEEYLFSYGLMNNIPVLGVCRGMQFIQHHYGVPLEKVSGHVACDHNIKFNGKDVIVNSYHRWASKKSVKELIITGIADDGVVEAIEHIALKVKGIMWHPERNKTFVELDKVLITTFFNNYI